jgi:opacity protein-like surface antigen
MKRLIKATAILAALFLASPASAADKGGPPAKVDATGEPKNFQGCYVQAAGQKMFLEVAGLGDSASTFLAGAGCDIQRGKLIFGLSGSYGFGENDLRVAEIAGRAGILVNPHALVYGLLSLTMDGRSPKLDDSFLSAGVGIELYLGSKHWTTFIEGATTIKSFGDTDGADLHSIKLGLKYRF